MNQLNSQSGPIADESVRQIAFLSFLWLLFAYSLPVLLESRIVNRLALEDGVVESVGALGFFVAAVLFFILYRRSRKQPSAALNPLQGNVFFLLLGLAFFFVAMEEISWGQRIIGFKTPEAMVDANVQREFNFHNLEIFHGETETGERKSFWALLLNMDRLFSLFWLSYSCLIPLLYRYLSTARRLLDVIGMPIVNLALGALFLLNYVASKILERFPGGDVHHAVVEIKETNIAILFVGVAVIFLRESRDTRQ